MGSNHDRLIFFDLGNVIALFSHEKMVENLAGVAGVSAEQVRGVVLGTELQRQYERGEISTRQFHAEFCQSLNCEATLEEVAFAASDIFRINTPMIPLISNLKQAGARLGILSNTCAVHWEWIFEHYLIVRDFFDEPVLSFEVHALKPDVEIYRKAEAIVGLPPEKIFFVDDRADNVEGARSAGWTAEVFESIPQLAQQLGQFGVKMNF